MRGATALKQKLNGRGKFNQGSASFLIPERGDRGSLPLELADRERKAPRYRPRGRTHLLLGHVGVQTAKNVFGGGKHRCRGTPKPQPITEHLSKQVEMVSQKKLLLRVTIGRLRSSSGEVSWVRKKHRGYLFGRSNNRALLENIPAFVQMCKKKQNKLFVLIKAHEEKISNVIAARNAPVEPVGAP
jgi:hypothetical protein